MSLTESLVIPLGTKMPAFTLPDPDDELHPGSTLYGPKGLLVVFTCNHCPYAQAVWPRVIRLADLAEQLEIATVAINPNIHPDYPSDNPDAMREEIARRGIKFPYLVDEHQEVARAFKAQCTPDIYLFNANHELVYHGRIDDNWKDETDVTQHDLRQAIEDLSAGKPVERLQYPSLGCSIKWRQPDA